MVLPDYSCAMDATSVLKQKSVIRRQRRVISLGWRASVFVVVSEIEKRSRLQESFMKQGFWQ